MRRFSGSAPLCARLLALTSISLNSGTTLADITGFTPGTYEYNKDAADAGAGPIVGADSIQLTTGIGERRSIFFYEKQSITSFTASFTYRASNIANSGNFQGVAFVLQNDLRGVDAIGDPSRTDIFGPFGLGYIGVAPSAAITIETDTSTGKTYSGYYTGGLWSESSPATGTVNAFSGHDINVSLAFTGSVLTVTMVDTVTGSTFTQPNLVGPLGEVLGSSTAYVGFTASTAGGQLGGGGGINQYLSNFVYTVPEPVSLLGLSSIALLALRRRG